MTLGLATKQEQQPDTKAKRGDTQAHRGDTRLGVGINQAQHCPGHHRQAQQPIKYAFVFYHHLGPSRYTIPN